jgi:hypothetical protein
MFEDIKHLTISMIICLVVGTFWGIFEIFQQIEYSSGFYCTLPTLHYTTRTFVICNFFLAVLCAMKIQATVLSTKVKPMDELPMKNA